DPRAVWVLVATLQMRDETTPERQAALELLRQATTLALRKIGDPLTAKPAAAPPTREASAGDEPEEKTEAKPEAETGSKLHPRLTGDLRPLTNEELVEVLKELVQASEEISWAKLESREPLLPEYLVTYDQRARTAETVGKEFHRRGGRALMKEVLDRQLAGHVAISNWWDGLELGA